METIPGLFLSLVAQDPARVLVHTPDGQDDGVWRWRGWPLKEIHQQISGLSRRLYSLGVSTGTPVAILAETSHEWMAIDLAVLCLGGVTVGIYPSLPGPRVVEQLAHSEARILVVGDAGLYQKIAPLLDELYDLMHVFSIAPVEGIPQLHPAESDTRFLGARAGQVRPSDPAAVVYTSGTTGKARGVVLTHRNLADTARASREVLPLQAGDRSILYLPMAHILQRIIGYRGLMEGAEGYFAPSIDALPDLLVQTQPTVLPVVPRVLEKIMARAEATAAARGPVSVAVLRWAIAVGGSAAASECAGRRVPRRVRWQRPLAERLVYQTIRARLGGALRLVVSGGAPLSPSVQAWFEAIGVSVREGWGLTETSGPVTLNPVVAYRPGSVGVALPGSSVDVSADGELLVRGPGVFAGYLNDDAATQAAFTPAGFFRTGDLGMIDDDGYVWIMGRRKEILVTAGGKNVPPVPVERQLETSPLIERAILVGDRRPYLCVLLALDEEVLAARAAVGSWPGDVAVWRTRQSVRASVQQHIDAINGTVASHETIKAFAFLPRPLTEEGRELTPTLKLRRALIAKKYAALIDALYA